MVFTGVIGALIPGTSGKGVVGALTPTPPAAPVAPLPIPAPSIMPTADSEQVTAAAKKQALIAQMQSGRASTILGSGTGTSDKLGA